MTFWDEVREKAAWAAEQVGETLNEVKDRTGTELEILKVKRQVSALETDVDGLYKKLGRRAFELAASGALADPEAKGLADEIESKKKEITTHEAEIERIRKLAEEHAQEKGETARATPEPEASKKEEEVDGEAIWEDDDRDEGTPPPP